MKCLSKPIDQPDSVRHLTWQRRAPLRNPFARLSRPAVLARAVVLAVLVTPALLVGCSSGGTPPVREASRVEVSAARATAYRVVTGDTLYSIAWRHQRDFRELAALNRISAPYSIYPGQLLAIRGKAPTANVAANSGRRPQSSTGSKTSSASKQAAVKQAAPRRKSAPHPLASTRTKPQSGNGVNVAGRSPTSSPAKPPARRANSAIATKPPKKFAATAASAATRKTPTSLASKRPVQKSSGPVRFRWPGAGKRVKSFGSKTSDNAGPSSSIEFVLAAGAPIRAASGGEVVYAGKGLAGYQQFVILKHNDTWLSAYGFNARSNVSEGQRVAAGSTLAIVPAGGASVAAGAADQARRLYFEVRKNGRPVNPDGVISKTGSG